MRPLIAVLATLAIALTAVSTAAAAEPISQFHLGVDDAVTTRVKMKAGQVYPMEISGTRTKVLGTSPPTTSLEDAFFCVTSTNPSCPPKADAPSAGVPITARTSETTTLHPLQEYVAEGEPMALNPTWRHPPYNAGHVYAFGFRPKLSGKLIITTSETCSPPSRCSGAGFDVKIFAPQTEEPADPCDGAAPTAGTAAVNEVRVVAVQPDVQWHPAGAPEDDWRPVCRDTVLQQGDEISCDPDGAVTLQFADNSTVVVKNTTQLKIASFFTEGGVVRTEILLKMGEIAAQVHKSEATASDFRIKAPTGTASVRGTDFSVAYDPGGKAMVTTVREGVVDVAPETAGLQPAQLTAGQEVEVTTQAVSPVAPIGQAGARGGLGRFAALATVLRTVARADEACRITLPRVNAFAVTEAPGGWSVRVKVLGKRKGLARWTIKGPRATAANPLAKAITKRCR